MMSLLQSRYFPAVLFALIVHTLFLALMLAGLSWPEQPRDFEMRPIQLEFANLQEAGVAPKPVPLAEAEAELKPEPEPMLNDSDALALRRQQEETQRLEEERRQREEQARLRAELEAERARQLEAERVERQRVAQQERQRQQQEQQRQEREEAAQRQANDAAQEQARQEQAQQEQTRLEQEQAAQRQQSERSQRLAEIAARGQGTATGMVGGSETSTVEPGLADTHLALIRRQIQQAWRLPPTSRSGMRVMVNIRLLPTGELLDVSVLQGSGNAEFDRSALEAVRSVNRFNVPRDPVVFENVFRSLNLDFDPDQLRL